MLLCDFWCYEVSSDSPKSHKNTNTDRVGGRQATPVFWEVKLLSLSMESGGLEESDFQFSSCRKMLSDRKVKW